MTDYETEYQRADDVCGDPFDEFVEFFDSADTQLSVLDLGCGQGRDALMAARRGHRVHAVDIAPTGIDQMLAKAKSGGLAITGEVADLESFETDQAFDVVVLDRVLHMLPGDTRRCALLAKVERWVGPGGHALIADTPSNSDAIRSHFAEAAWQPTLETKNYLFVRRPA